MKKILLYTDTPQTGGAELQMFLLAKFINKDHFTPILACSNYPALDKWCENFEKEGIKVIRLDVKHKHDPRHLLHLKKILKEEEISILHAHLWNPASCRYAFPAASFAKIPVIVTEHDPFKISALKNILKKHSLKGVSKIITVSRNNQQILEKLYPSQRDKMQVIHNGIDLSWWQSQLLRFTDNDRKHIKEEIFLAKENSLIIIAIAELHERKGLKYLIEAVPSIIAKFPNIKLVIVGEGSEKSELFKLVKKLDIQNHVTLTGKQKGIPKLLKSSDIFALPSRREAFGLVNLEAMITPLPVVATAVGGIPEIVQHEITGLLTEPENSQSLAEALLELIAKPDKREKMASAGQKRVVDSFSAKGMAERYERVYEEMGK